MPRAIVIPSFTDKAVTKPSKGDVLGTLWATKSIDLTTKPGVFRLADRIVPYLLSSTDGDLDVPTAFIRTNADTTDRWWAITQASVVSRTDGLMWKTTDTTPTNGWTQDAIASTPTDACDNMVIFGQASGYDRLVVSRDTDLTLMNNGAWTASWWVTTLGQSALSAANPHHIHTFLNMILVPDGNVVHVIDDALVVTLNRIVLPKEYRIRWIADDKQFVYFGTQNTRSGDGLVFRWDGTSETYNDYFESGSDRTHAGKADVRNVMHIVNANGELRQFTGTAFEEVARFPFHHAEARTWYDELTDASLGVVNVAMHQNGMELIGDKLSFLISAAISDSADRPMQNFQGGIWEYDPNVGLYLKNPISRASTEWGTENPFNVGALKYTNATNQAGRILAGATIYTDNASTSVRGIFANQGTDVSAHRGYFVTSWIQTGSDFASFWKRLKASVRSFSNSTDAVVFKYRSTKVPRFDDDWLSTAFFDVTWASTTTFTINDANGANLAVGDEIEVICGGAVAGALAHITAIVNTSGNNYTITIDETLTNASGASYVRVARFKKLGSIATQSVEQKIMTIAKRSKFIQFKVELRGDLASPELEELFAEFNPSTRK